MDKQVKQEKLRRQYNKRYVKRNKKKEHKMGKHSRRCPHCAKEMKCRGASDCSGGISWKCKNKKCGKTLWERRIVSSHIPLAPKSLMNRM